MLHRLQRGLRRALLPEPLGGAFGVGASFSGATVQRTARSNMQTLPRMPSGMLSFLKALYCCSGARLTSRTVGLRNGIRRVVITVQRTVRSNMQILPAGKLSSPKALYGCSGVCLTSRLVRGHEASRDVAT